MSNNKSAHKKESAPAKDAPAMLPTSWVGKTPTQDQWRQILEVHARWRRGMLGGQRANLQDANLQHADLRGANLQDAYLQDAHLRGANLQHANLQHANLQHADLRGANLQDAYLQDAHLRGANLQHANLQGANLLHANLQHADLQHAYLRHAYLQHADLRGANLQHAKNAEFAIAQTRILPEGDLIGWKKCRDGVLVRLSIPAAAKRSHAFGRKCRAEYARVLEVIGGEVGISNHDGKTEYRSGSEVRAEKWDENWMEECTGGIHFFISRVEAEAWQ